MNKINFFLKKMVTWFRKHYYLGSCCILFFILFILLLPILRSNWLAYPESLKIRIALSRFINSFEKYTYCREDCAAERSFYSKIIEDSLFSNNNYQGIIQKEVFKSDISNETRLELLKLYKNISPLAPADIKNYYINPSNNFMIRAALSETRPELNNASFLSEIIGKYKNSISVAEKLVLLDFLDGQSDALVFSLLWEIVLNNEGEDLKKKAFLLLASIDRKDLVYKITDLNNIQLILNDNNYEMRLKDSAIWLLNDYYQYFPVPSETLLLSVINGSQFDNYQKTFAINILNNQKLINLKIPELTQSDWKSYYNN
jgi:hypothetical protein